MDVDISIVIVNYNVQFFLGQCLHSIFNQSDFTGILEVIVVDNNSEDGSLSMIETKFPKVSLIRNNENVGFSVANNQGLRIAKGRYCLMLNPDTILEENTLSKCFQKMESDADIGALGVRMVDGSGSFLPESKRGLPTPLTSFYKFTGIHKLFPKSSKISAYYQGHIGEFETAPIDILCGAFMFMRRSDLEKIGLLDEAFFMYGEDIDLSYRFRLANRKVLYFSETTIIHFKGESTKKNSLAYTRRFYNAMQVFANKHFASNKASTFIKYLSWVINMKAAIQHFRNFGSKVLLPILEAFMIFSGLFLIARLWANYYFKDATYYTEAPLIANFSIYTVIWLVFLFYGGAYDAKLKWDKIFRSILIGTLTILAFYGLFPEEYRSSRAVIIIGSIFVFLLVLSTRAIRQYWKTGKFDIFRTKGRKVFVISNADEAENIKSVLEQSNRNFDKVMPIPPKVSASELQELIEIHQIEEIICNSKDLGMNRIIGLMSTLGDRVSFKITGDETLGIIGSQSKNKSGEIYTVAIQYKIQEQENVRLKRTIDFLGSIALVLLYPLILLKGKRIHLWLSLIGKKTLVGYNPKDKNVHKLPFLKSALIYISASEKTDAVIHEANIAYAKEYSPKLDIFHILNFIRA